MEFTLVRGFVLLIALMGFGASTTTSNSRMRAQDDNIIGGGGPPQCAPNSGQYCGMQ